MHEQPARNIVLVQAIEQGDQQREVLSADDRLYATRSAAELARWDASEQKGTAGPTPQLFLHKRAELLLKRITERHPAFARLTSGGAGTLHAVGIALPVVAFLVGALVDRISDPHRVDLLSAPLLSIVGWNLLVYAVLLLATLVPAWRAHRGSPHWVTTLMQRRMPTPRRLPQALVLGIGQFTASWVGLTRPLTAARWGRMLHWSAACLALGVVASLYLRGLFAEYRVGWESTFLDAGQVHAALTLLYWPVTTLFQLPALSIAEVQALRFTTSATAQGGALWVHLNAGTLLLLVILPRAILGAVAARRARWLASHIPIDLGQPYFRQLTGQAGLGEPGVLRVLPYSYTLDETRATNLGAVARTLLGPQASVLLRPSTGYGEDPAEALRGTELGNPDITLTAALFNLSATPEKENHGQLLDYLARTCPRGVSVLLDESGFVARTGTGAGAASRLQERIALWRQFCALHQVPATIVNLADPQLRQDDLAQGVS